MILNVLYFILSLIDKILTASHHISGATRNFKYHTVYISNIINMINYKSHCSLLEVEQLARQREIPRTYIAINATWNYF